MATCPSMGDVDDAEDSPAPAEGQGPSGPCLKEDGLGLPGGHRNQFRPSGLLVHEEGQVQRVARHLQPGVKAQGCGDWRQETEPFQNRSSRPWSLALLPIFSPPLLIPFPSSNTNCPVLSLMECGCCSLA